MPAPFNIIKPRRSTTPSAVPTGLANGELAINIPDKLIYVGNSSGGGVLVSNYALAGSVTVYETEIDFGSTSSNSRKFTITDANVNTSSKVIAVQSAKAATGRKADENELTDLICSVDPKSGSFDLFVKCTNGLAHGKYKINYIIG